jgi:F-type H+-transporting ATPase subunit alpha
MKQIDESGDYNDEIEASLKESIEDFKKNHSW